MSEDIIYREDAIKAYNEAMDELVKWQMEEWQLGDFSECEFNTTDCKHIARKIEAIPSADRPQGEWKRLKGDEWLCSNCGYVVWTEGSWEHPLERGKDYCEHCGARMKGADIHDFTDCDFCKDRNCKDCEGGKDEPQTERSSE